MEEKELKILYWNARSLNQRKYELPHLLSTVDIFICVETWLTNSENENGGLKIPGFQILRKDRNHAQGGGILITVRNSLDAIELNHIAIKDERIEISGIKITNIIPALDIIACYKPPRDKNKKSIILTQEEWHNVVSTVKRNSHCMSWSNG